MKQLFPVYSVVVVTVDSLLPDTSIRRTPL